MCLVYVSEGESEEDSYCVGGGRCFVFESRERGSRGCIGAGRVSAGRRACGPKYLFLEAGAKVDISKIGEK